MKNAQQTGIRYGWNTFWGSAGGVVQVVAGIAAVPAFPVGGGALIGSGTACAIYSATTDNDEMSKQGYIAAGLVGGTVGAIASNCVLPVPTRAAGEAVTLLQYTAPLGASATLSLLSTFFTKKDPEQHAAPQLASKL